MTMGKAHAWWENAQLALLMLFVALGIVGAFGCEVPDEPPLVAPPAEEPEVNVQDDEAFKEWLAKRKAAPVRGDGMLHFEEDERFDRDTRFDTDEVEKGGYPQLTGWGVRGCLAYQDGLQEYCGLDHCALFGLTCDNEWHSQAAALGYYDTPQFVNEMMGGCAPNVAGRAWEPCILPRLEPADRTWSWFFDEDSCPNDPTGRQLLHDAFKSAARYHTDFALVDMPEAGSEATANVVIRCAAVGELADFEGMQWSPYGDIQLRYALAEANESVILADYCEIDGLPGSGSPALFAQSMDMHYTYSYSTIQVNYDALFDILTQCAQNPGELQLGFRNVFMHELGHNWGWQHDQYWSLDYGVMYGEASACEDVIIASKGFGPLRLNALYDLDVSTSTDALTAYDEDLSCYLPNQ